MFEPFPPTYICTVIRLMSGLLSLDAFKDTHQQGTLSVFPAADVFARKKMIWQLLSTLGIQVFRTIF